jgi:hypothetical protein
MINFYTERTDAGVLQGSWDKVWLVSMGISIAMLIVMVIFFNPKCDKETAEA